MNEPTDLGWFEALRTLLDRAHLVTPDRLATLVDEATGRLGLRTTIWVIDHEQHSLHALPVAGRETPKPVAVDGSVGGRTFTAVASTHSDEGGADRWWVPMVDGTDRLGVIEYRPVAPPSLEDDQEFVVKCELLSGLVGHLLATITMRGDHLELVRRSRPMSIASELLWRQLQPLTSSCGQAVVTAILQPCYEVGGDGFDYVLENSTAYLVVLDAMGRGLRAGLACAVALAAIRASRRAGGKLEDQAGAADAALVEQFPDSRFATALLAELELDTGRLRYLNAGHPEPLVLRGRHLVRTLSAGRRMPLGITDPVMQVAQERLEPGDRLVLYTDGVTEARTAGGERFGVDRLVDHVRRHAAAGLPAPETLRRLARAVLDHQPGAPGDDATLMLVEWSGTAALNTVPRADQPGGEDEEPS
jgi:sigma-B regulation protein RsbU (phosphoserine phosphatase)